MEEEHGLSEFLIQISKATSFRELEDAFKKTSEDFERIVAQDTKGNTSTFVKRFKALSQKATEILENGTQEQPSTDERAIFCEMIALRDFCFRLLETTC